jgi:hypothetical protein
MLDYLSNPEDPRFQAAMKHGCGLCGAKPNRPCWNIVAADGAPLPHRLIHSYRIPPETLTNAHRGDRYTDDRPATRHGWVSVWSEVGS